jgi:TRAP-type C4-dicarboxylate transport system permease small subunit
VENVKFRKLVNSGIQTLCGVLLLIIVSVTFIQIILRQFFKFTFNWSDEVAQFCMMWLTLFGSIWVTKKGQHLSTGLKLHKKLNERQSYLVDGILALLIAGTAVVIFYYSIIFSITAMSIESLSLSWLKMGYIFIAMPLVMMFMIYYYLKSFFENIALFFNSYSSSKI